MRRKSRHLPANPFLAWTNLALTFAEMGVASAQVIAHRTARMAAAGPTPNARDRVEFTRMGQEKIDAASASMRAMAVQAAGMNARLGSLLLRDMVNGSAAWFSLAGSRTVGQAMARQTKLAQHVSKSAITAATLSNATARLAKTGMAPVHARATANARRLAKR
jgi:hypothetical protein